MSADIWQCVACGYAEPYTASTDDMCRECGAVPSHPESELWATAPGSDEMPIGIMQRAAPIAAAIAAGLDGAAAVAIAAALTCGQCGGSLAADYPMGEDPAEWLIHCRACSVTVAYVTGES